MVADVTAAAITLTLAGVLFALYVAWTLHTFAQLRRRLERQERTLNRRQFYLLAEDREDLFERPRNVIPLRKPRRKAP